MGRTTILAFGFAAQSGKGACVDFLSRAYKSSSPLVISFASALRKEINDSVQEIAARYLCPPKEALEILCYRKGVEHDPFAKPDTYYPYGKQRLLLQVVGMEKRAISKNYWVDKLDEEVAKRKPTLVLIDDLRFMSEVDWVVANGGSTIHVYRPGNTSLSGAAASHVSEHELAQYAFDHTIVNNSSLTELHSKANKVFHQITQLRLF